MEAINGRDEYDLLQCHIVPSVPRSPVHCGEVRSVDTIPSCYTAAAVQNTAAKWFLDMGTAHDDYKVEVRTAIVRKLMSVTEDSLYIVRLLTPTTD